MAKKTSKARDKVIHDKVIDDKVMPSLSLSELCSEAADHVAKARVSLFDDSYDTEAALLHLDEAIFCLKRILTHGRAGEINGACVNGASVQRYSA